jgi:hypothetical protein
MERDVRKIAKQYDAIAGEYAETFAGEQEKKPRDMEKLRRFTRI